MRNKVPKVRKTCPRCQKEFWLWPSTAILRTYCSQNCKTPPVLQMCPVCHKDFRIKLRAPKRITCSAKCWSNRKGTYTCEQCHKTSETFWSNLPRRFCSDSCRLQWFSTHFQGENSPHWQGGITEWPYGPNWGKQRRAMLRRDANTCRHCGTKNKRGLAAAHIVPFKAFGIERYEEANHIDNLLTLCRSCHTKFDFANGTRT